MRHFALKAAVAAFFIGTAVTASAANPFSDVEKDSWAYGAIASLSDQNIIEGYPDGTFRGDKHITRYELAQITARLMAKRATLSTEQQATVDKLSGEYADELKNLGVRVSELEKKVGNTQLITEIRVQGINRYDNIFKDTAQKHYELGTRVRLNTITSVNDRSTIYGQMETYMSMNGNPVYDVNKYSYDKNGNETIRAGHGDGELHLNRLWTTYQFGEKQDTTNLPFGPSKNLIGIGQFPVKMGVTGYTYDGEFKGAFIQFGDYLKGGHLTLAYGRATNINYDYTGPMMRGVKVTPVAKNKLISELSTNKVVQAAVAANPALLPVLNTATNLINSSNNLAELQANLGTIVTVIQSQNPALAQAVAAKLGTLNLGALASGGSMYYDVASDTLYPMGKDVMMDWGEDEDVPVSYVSYIYKVPEKWEAHAYAMKANGPVGNICEAYGFAGSYYVTPKWNIHGEYVKNLRTLPLNNEKPHSFNYGISYGTASVLQPKSYSIGIDYVYSQAGTYFGGSGNDVADQYMGHVYSNWNGMRVPAYFADKMDALTDGDPSNDNNNFGGAKFFLAKAAFVPIKGLIVEANYGFNAEDMGGKKMDNILMLKATAYIK